MPRIQWDAFEENMEKIIDAGGGFENCSTSDVVTYLRELCLASLEKWDNNDSILIERASSAIVFSCEVRSDVTFVQWRMESSQEFDLKCLPGAHMRAMKSEPAFVFDKKGRLEAIEFWARNGQRQSINTSNCRRKLQLTLSRNIKPDSMDAVDRLPRLKSDPQDFVMGNRICFEYDVTSEWSGVRGSLPR